MKSEGSDEKRLVLDTNILISGYLWRGKARQLLQHVKSFRYSLLICKESVEEFVRVLSLKFDLDTEDIYRIIIDLRSMAEEIKLTSNHAPIKDDLSDNLFINLAIDGKAKIIVSGDSHLLKLKKYQGIRIIGPNEFLRKESLE
jgi:putative PIN family toxin of toxin-antitoxin system